MPQTPGGIEYTMNHNRGANDPNGFKASWAPGVNSEYWEVWIDFEDYQNFTTELLGTMRWVPAQGLNVTLPAGGGGSPGVGGTIVNVMNSGYLLDRSLPMRHPENSSMIVTHIDTIDFPAVPTDFAEVEYNGQLATNPDGTPARVLLGINFQSVNYDLVDNATAWNSADGELTRYVERPFKFNIEALTLKGVILQYVDTLRPVGAEPTITFPSSERLYVWKRVPAQAGQFPPLLYANIVATMGCTNSDTFDGIPPYRLLCGAPTVDLERGASGLREYTIKYPLMERPLRPPATQAWNSKFRPTDAFSIIAPAFYDVQIKDTGGRRPYTAVPFANLFLNA